MHSLSTRKMVKKIKVHKIDNARMKIIINPIRLD